MPIPYALPACCPANSVTENDLKIGDQQRFLKNLYVMETPQGFYLVARMQGRLWYIVTRRNRLQPRMFQNLHRLNEGLREQFPRLHFELLRQRALPDPAAPADVPIVPDY
jgi:hypothetical protein